MPLSDRWESNNKGIINRIAGNFRREPPLKVRLQAALREVKVLSSQLSNALLRIENRDRNIFSQVINSIKKGDKEHATMYANELSELRKLGKFVSQAQLALEYITLRLETLLTLGELTAGSLAPAVSVLREIEFQVVEVLPEAKGNVEDLFGTLNSVLAELSADTGTEVNFEIANSEARKILDEAEIVAEGRMRESFPEVPLELEVKDVDEELTT